MGGVEVSIKVERVMITKCRDYYKRLSPIKQERTEDSYMKTNFIIYAVVI